MKVFVGLGNPGTRYAGNRHNVGFMALDRMASDHDFEPWRKKFQAEISEGTVGGERVLLIKPQTYMNESGQSVGAAARFLKVAPSDIFVFHDELDLAPGKVKVKTGGGNAGHNGLRSVSAHIGNDFVRVRLGIGHPGSREAVVPFVLNDFAKSDQDWLDVMLSALSKSLPHLAHGDSARYLSDVARATSDTPSDSNSDADKAPVRPKAPSQPKRPVKTRHPSGERASKRQSALAENLKKWLGAQPGSGEGEDGKQ